MSWIATGVTVVGTATSIIGGFGKKKAAKRLGELNARLFESQAQYMEEANREKLRRFRLQGKALQSSQQQGYAASGVRTSEGSPLEILYQTAKELTVEREFMIKSGQREVEMTRLQGVIAKAGGKAAGAGMGFEAAGSILNTVAFGINSYNHSTTQNPKV